MEDLKGAQCYSVPPNHRFPSFLSGVEYCKAAFPISLPIVHPSTNPVARDPSHFLHVVDAATALREERIDEVNLVLEEIGASSIPQLMVYNKVDLIAERPRIEKDRNGVAVSVWISSITGDGKELLLDAISGRLTSNVVETSITLRPEDGRMRARFFEIGAVVDEVDREDGSTEIFLKIQESSLKKIAGHRVIAG